MPTMSSLATVQTIEGVSRLELIRELGLATGYIQTGTATGGAVNYLDDTNNLKSVQYNPTEWIGGWIRISSTSGNVAPEANIRTIKDYQPDLGRIYPDPVFSGAIAAGATYELWKIEPARVLLMIDQALVNDLYIPCWSVLSQVADSDMEQSATTDWASTNATVTKQTTGIMTGVSGKRYLRVVATAANGYAKSNTLNVIGGKNYHASARCRATASTTTAKLQVWDETNGVEITSVTTTYTTPVRLFTQWIAPATCYLVSYRLITVTNSGTTEWDDVSGYGFQDQDIIMPWWLKNRQQIKGIFSLYPIGLANNTLDPNLHGEYDKRWDIYDNYGGGSKFRAQARVGTMPAYPLFCLGLRNETAYNSDVSTDTADLKYIDIPYFLACVKYKLFDFLSNSVVTSNIDRKDIVAKAAQSLKEWQDLAYQQEERLEKTIKSDTPWGMMLDSRFTYGGAGRGFGGNY